MISASTLLETVWSLAVSLHSTESPDINAADFIQATCFISSNSTSYLLAKYIQAHNRVIHIETAESDAFGGFVQNGCNTWCPRPYSLQSPFLIVSTSRSRSDPLPRLGPYKINSHMLARLLIWSVLYRNAVLRALLSSEPACCSGNCCWRWCQWGWGLGGGGLGGWL